MPAARVLEIRSRLVHGRCGWACQKNNVMVWKNSSYAAVLAFAKEAGIRKSGNTDVASIRRESATFIMASAARWYWHIILEQLRAGDEKIAQFYPGPTDLTLCADCFFS